MVGVLAQRWMKAEKAKKEKNPTADQILKDLEEKIRKATAAAVAEMDKKTFELCLKMAKETK